MDESERVLALLQRIDERRVDAAGTGRADPALLTALRALVAEAEARGDEKTPAEVEGMR